MVPPGAGRRIETVELAAGGVVFFVADGALHRAEILPIAVGLGSYATVVRESAGALDLTVALSHAADRPVAVANRVLSSTALVGEDVAAASGTVSFAVGELRKPLQLRILDSPAVESAERFTLELHDPAGRPSGSPRSWTWWCSTTMASGCTSRRSAPGGELCLRRGVGAHQPSISSAYRRLER